MVIHQSQNGHKNTAAIDSLSVLLFTVFITAIQFQFRTKRVRSMRLPIEEDPALIDLILPIDI